MTAGSQAALAQRATPDRGTDAFRVRRRRIDKAGFGVNADKRAQDSGRSWI
jgi:hypothetical protein